ncbi:MAG: 50S ribosomal protein L29 [bacterium]
MKTQKQQIKKLHTLDLKELSNMVSKKRTEIINLKRQIRFGKVKNTSKIQQSKKDLARILTIISEKAEQQVQQSLENNQKKDDK